MLGIGILIAESLYNYRSPLRTNMTAVLVEDGREQFFPINSVLCYAETSCIIRLLPFAYEDVRVSISFDPPASPYGECTAESFSGVSLICNLNQSFNYLYGKSTRPYIQIEDRDRVLDIPNLSRLYGMRMRIATVLGSLALGRISHWMPVMLMFSMWVGLNVVNRLERRREENLRRRGISLPPQEQVSFGVNLLIFIASTFLSLIVINFVLATGGVILE